MKPDSRAEFPVTAYSNCEGGSFQYSIQEQSGISLRQWYAGMALPGMCYAHDYSKKGPCIGVVAKRAFAIADAMIAEGEKGK